MNDTLTTTESEIIYDNLHEQIASRAYSIYLKAGCPVGCALEHWLTAEAEMQIGGLITDDVNLSRQSNTKKVRRKTSGQGII